MNKCPLLTSTTTTGYGNTTRRHRRWHSISCYFALQFFFCPQIILFTVFVPLPYSTLLYPQKNIKICNEFCNNKKYMILSANFSWITRNETWNIFFTFQFPHCYMETFNVDMFHLLTNKDADVIILICNATKTAGFNFPINGISSRTSGFFCKRRRKTKDRWCGSGGLVVWICVYFSRSTSSVGKQLAVKPINGKRRIKRIWWTFAVFCVAFCFTFYPTFPSLTFNIVHVCSLFLFVNILVIHNMYLCVCFCMYCVSK